MTLHAAQTLATERRGYGKLVERRLETRLIELGLTKEKAPNKGQISAPIAMKNFCILLLLSAVLAIGSLLSPSRLAGAQEAVDQSHVALLLEGAADRGLLAKPPLYHVKHDLCGIGLGGYCPGRYRSCIRAGRPKAECEAWVARCDACNQAMLECRQKVGHQPGYTCPQCRKDLDKCRAGLSAPVK